MERRSPPGAPQNGGDGSLPGEPQNSGGVDPHPENPRTMGGWIPTRRTPRLWGTNSPTPTGKDCVKPAFMSKRLFFKLKLEKLELKVNVRRNCYVYSLINQSQCSSTTCFLLKTSKKMESVFPNHRPSPSLPESSPDSCSPARLCLGLVPAGVVPGAPWGRFPSN